MSMKLMTAGMVAAIGLTAFCGELSISGVTAKQRSLDNGLVDIAFDVSSDSNTVSVILSAMNTATSQMVPMKAVFDTDGNFVGNPAKIAPGAGKKLIWNSAIDLGKGFYSDKMVITARATEKDLPPSYYEKYLKTKENYNKAVAAVNAAEANLLATSNAWVEASYYNRQVQGGSYSTLKEVGETLTKGEQYQKAYDAIVTAYEKKIEDSGCDFDDAFTDVIFTSFHYAGDEVARSNAFKASDLYKYAAAYADCAATWSQTTVNAAYGKFRYETKQITAQQYKSWFTDLVTAAQKALANAKVDFVRVIETYTCADKVQQAKDKAAFETYYAAYNTRIEDFTELEADWTYNENMYEQSWQYNDEGVALTSAEIEALQKEAAEDATAATKAYGEAQTALSKAKDELQTAETVCLIVIGSKDGK